VGEDKVYGPLEVRYAQHADALLERLAAEHRASETVCLVSSDSAVRGTSGQEVQKRSSRTFLGDLDEPGHVEAKRSQLRDRVDEETRKRLEKLRRGQGSG
jgi:predicted RNA-binding protein with PIN domain